jgi:RND family efflux transporter MFP subunit
MAESDRTSNLLQVLRSELLPYLQACRDPERLSELLDRLAGYLNADGAVLWRTEEERVSALAIHGCVEMEWTRAHAAICAGAEALRGGAAVLSRGDARPYRADVSGARLDQVVAFPLRGPKGSVGAVELWWRTGGHKPAGVNEILPLLEDALNQALPSLLEYEAERRNYIGVISRLIMLYDIGKVFHSTLELGELAGLIASRVQNILEADEAAVWLLDPVKKSLYCGAVAGPRPGAFEGVRVWANEPGLGAALSAGEAVLLQDVEDEAWVGRWGAPILSLAAVPLMQGNSFLGAIEAVRRQGTAFTEEELRLLIDVGKSASVALRNAQRHLAERRVNELNALVEISREISATLDLDRVLATTVNRITTVIPADRCSVALQRKGRWELSAISGQLKVERKGPAVQQLETMHVWLAGSGGDIHLSQTDAGVAAEREEVRDKFAGYFRDSGMRAFTGLLLQDEEGTVGTLILESKDPEALTASHNDLARIFSSQVTVALRNALLYQQVPLIGVLQPLIEKKSKFSALPAVRRRVIVAGAALALGFLILFPVWSKPSGEARVLPERIQPVSAEVEGTVRRVLVREGHAVQAGEVLAEIAPENQRVVLERAQSEHDILSRRVLQLEAAGNLGEARLERARLQQASAELDLQRRRLGWTQIRSPIAGVMITPRIEEREGQFLKPGDVLCQVVSLDRAWVEIAVPEIDVGPIQPGQEAWVKLNTYPARKFVGQVVRVAPQGRDADFARVFDVIVEIPNDDRAIRAGMMGRGKVLAERVRAGYLVLRAPLRWLWLKLWPLLP